MEAEKGIYRGVLYLIEVGASGWLWIDLVSARRGQPPRRLRRKAVSREERRVGNGRCVKAFNKPPELGGMVDEGFFGLSTEAVESRGAELADSGLHRIGDAVVFRKQVFAVSVPYESSASPTLTVNQGEDIGWKARTGSANFSGWDSHSHRGFNCVSIRPEYQFGLE